MQVKSKGNYETGGRRGRMTILCGDGDIDGQACPRSKNWRGRDHGSMMVCTVGLLPIRENHGRYFHTEGAGGRFNTRNDKKG